MTVQNSLLDQNSALNGGGDAGAILNFGGDGPAATLVVRDSTIAFNSARLTGGILEYGNPADSTTLTRVTVAYNQSGDRGGGAIAGNAPFHVSGSILASNFSQVSDRPTAAPGLPTTAATSSPAPSAASRSRTTAGWSATPWSTWAVRPT